MSVKINTTELLKILEKCPAEQNIMLSGKHGIGKSQILEKYYSQKGYKVVTLFLGQMSDPGDLIGIPHKNEKTGHTEFLPPYWFPTDEIPVVLFLDELNRARPEVLQTIMDLALNRKLAGKSLPKGSRIISAVNNGDEYQLTDLDPALVSRFNVYEFVPTVQEWLLWAAKNGIDERIIKFISQNDSFLDGDGKETDYTGLEKSPDRRGWEKVSSIIKGNLNLDFTDKKMISGIVGVRAANLFFESFGKSKILSAEELLLNDFEKSEISLKRYDTPDFAVENDEIFRFLEVASSNLSDAKKSKISGNLSKYILFMKSQNRREAMAHFANLFSKTTYPNAIAFIINESPDVFDEITRFISSMK